MDQQELPKFHETFNPILEILKDGQIRKHSELIDEVIKKYYSDLSSDLLSQRIKTGERLIVNRIAWGKSYLKKGGYVFYPIRGAVQITDKGITSLGRMLQLKDIVDDAYFKDTQDNKTKEEISETPQIDNSSPQDLIDAGITEIENQLKADLLDRLKNIDPYYFEKVILILLKKMGYGDFIETPKSGDGGVDGIMNEDKLGLNKIYIQAKRYGENKVREKEIRNFIGAMSGDTDKGVFVTTSDFDSGAITKAHDAHHTIILIDGKKLVDLMHEFNVGVQVKSTYEVKQLDEDFFENE